MWYEQRADQVTVRNFVIVLRDGFRPVPRVLRTFVLEADNYTVPALNEGVKNICIYCIVQRREFLGRDPEPLPRLLLLPS